MLTSIILSVIAGFVVLFIQLSLIEKRAKRRAEERDKKLWTPFRIIFLQGVCDFCDNISDTIIEYTNSCLPKLDEIKLRRKLTIEDWSFFKSSFLSFNQKAENHKSDFYYILQTAGPSLQPIAGEYCSEVVNYTHIIRTYSRQIEDVLLDFDESKIHDEKYISDNLSALWAKISAIEMIYSVKIKGYKNEFTNKVWKTERLYYHDGYFMDEKNYKGALDVERAVESLNKIPRDMPIKSFFDV